MKRIKDIFLSSLNENENNSDEITDDVIDINSIDEVIGANFLKNKEFVEIVFSTTFGKNFTIVSKYSDFKKWYSDYKAINKLTDNPLRDYVVDFFKNSKKVMSEIIDDNGNIMSSDDTPSNATNRHVGMNLKWDLEKVYHSMVPRRYNRYTSNYGYGFVVW